MTNITSTEQNLLSILPNDWKLVFGILMGVISIIAIIENAIVLATMFYYQVLHTNTNKILSSLALSDFLTAASVGTLFTLQLLDENSIQNTLLNNVRRYLSTMLIGASVFTLAFISYDRSLHLRLLNRYKMTRKKLFICLCICWIIPALIPILRKVDDSESAYSAVIVLFATLVLFGIMFCYGIIFNALRVQQKLAAITYKCERRAAKTVFIILTVFSVTIIPICIHHSLNISQALPPWLLARTYIIGMTLCVASSTINPVIYYFRTPYLKTHIMRLLGIWNANMNSFTENSMTSMN